MGFLMAPLRSGTDKTATSSLQSKTQIYNTKVPHRFQNTCAALIRIVFKLKNYRRRLNKPDRTESPERGTSEDLER